jgi:hypothetical protein
VAKEQALKRTAMLSTRTTEAGSRAFKTWCARRRLHHTAVMRDAIIEYMQRHDKDMPEVTRAD